MAESELPVSLLDALEGLPIPYEDANVDGNFYPDPREKRYIMVENTSGIDIHVDFITQSDTPFGPYKDNSRLVGAGETRPMLIYDAERFHDLQARVHVEYPDGVFGVRVACLELVTYLKDSTV